MTRFTAWLSAAWLLLLVSAAIALALASLIPGTPELARRAEAQLSQALGVPVTVKGLRWHLWPVPRLVIDDVATVQPQPVRVRQLTLYAHLPEHFALSTTLADWLRIGHIEVEGAELPQLSLRGLGQGDFHALDAARIAPDSHLTRRALARLVFRDVNWVSRSGQALRYEGEIDFDDDWRPRSAQVRRADVQPAAALRLTRHGVQDRWNVSIELAEGSVDGYVFLRKGADKPLRLEGSLQAHRIDAAAAARSFGLEPLLVGQLSGQTALWAEGASAGELAKELRTRSTFDVKAALLLGFNLDKALRTEGRDAEGETPLGVLTGQLDTRNTGQGVELNFSALKAEASGHAAAMAVSGRLRVSPAQRIDAQFELDLLAGLGSQLLQVSGPIERVTVTLPRLASGHVAGSAARTMSP